MNNPIARPRVPHELLFVVGGWSGGSPTNIVETYDTRADRWIVCETMDTGGCQENTLDIFVLKCSLICLFVFIR